MQTERILIAPVSTLTEGFLIPMKGAGAALTLGDVCHIGRDSTCDLPIQDPFASGRHARIERRGGQFILRDLGSKNGTYLNGARINESALSIGDKLKFGEAVYIFAESSGAEPELTSKSFTWNEQLRRIPAFAATDFPVLITGPSGSGKEILARALHKLSVRSRGEFVSLNCSALSESLIESELFGHIRGSFTGATSDRKGAFETARGGTLFLDEIGDLPLSLQPKLLRALEASEIRAVGSDKSISTDVRIVAATHKNIGEAIREGRFREDLYYRLNVCQVSPPALRERMEDFEDLLYTFAKHFRVRFSFNAINALKTHAWNGNIRELKNVIARSSAYYPGQLIQPEDLAAILEPAHQVASTNFGSERSQHSSVIKEIEREIIVRRLLANHGNQRRTARDLGIPKSTLHDRIKHYEIDVKELTASER